LTGDTLRELVNKRLTLNWLIQGAAQHAGMTFHHIIREDLDSLNPKLVPLYDKYALMNLLQYWHIEGAILLGYPPLFWNLIGFRRWHPFSRHPLIRAYGSTLAKAGRKRALARSREKGVTRIPLLFSFEVVAASAMMGALEMPHRERLIKLAKQATSMIWGIPQARLNAGFARTFDIGTPIQVRSVRDAVLKGAITGLGGVVRDGATLQVVGRGTNWQLLTKELVKGTAELICMHGMNDLDDDTYQKVIRVADRLDLEPWMLQTGGELWRRLLLTVPEGRRIAEVLMHIARLEPRPLEAFVKAVIEQPDFAREIVISFGAGDDQLEDRQ
jgi:hypothetical protein